MKSMNWWRLRAGLAAVAIAAVLAFHGCSDVSDEPVGPQPGSELQILSKDDPGIARAIQVQNKYNPALMKLDDVLGTGTGVTDEGSPAVILFTERGVNAVLPTYLEGIPVVQRVTGKIVALQGKGKPGATIDPKARFLRPVPIGVSTGNINECASGTIGCRVRIGDGYYALSNNHVFARENAAAIGEPLVQPGRYDLSCATFTSDIIGTLAAKKDMVFSTSASNTIDAAIASVTTAMCGNATPANGYGLPSSTIAAPALNMEVQKYGRTTGFTSGVVSAINVTVNVGYTAGVARFVNQFAVSAKKSFSKAGDSGSLIVTKNAACNPTGLLFAGSNTVTFANPISAVLTEFNATIDGK